MKFGVLQFFSWRDRTIPLPAIYERAMQRICVMDRSGYDAVWLAEHHFTGYSVCPSVHVMGAHVASRTSNLRIGMAVSLAAFYHPLRLAEEVALLDVLSGGRVNWGAGRGFDPVEFRAFGVPVEESGRRFHEAVEIVLAAWMQDRLNWSGEFWKFEDIRVLPKPLQQPHPPVWLAAGSEGAVRWSARHGYSIMLGPHSTFQENLAHRELYRAELEKSGHSIEGRTIPMARLIAVEDTDSEAERTARAGVEWLAATYMNASKVTNAASREQNVLLLSESDMQMRRYMDTAIVHGCPERVRDEIEKLREEMYLDYLLCAPLSHSSFMNFTEKVLPHFL